MIGSGGGGIVPKHKTCGIDFGPGGKLLRKPGKDGVPCYLVKKKQKLLPCSVGK